MEPDFWHKRWESGQIGFHQSKPNAFLVDHIQTLNLPKGARIFLPLCGKTHDIAWLLAEGYQVVGAELSAIAIDQLFDALGVTPDTTKLGPLTRQSADSIDIFVGDIFELDQSTLGPVDAIYDRAALVALPADMRIGYANHLAAITNAATQLLVTFEYDQSFISGPPFAIWEDELRRLYDAHFALECLARGEVSGGMKGHPATEAIWHLTA
ncbi:thiopurine S-methyltransferase [Litoreibacter janthinus]|uniref:Thiopurine S-methyltransferase n=1 Tax=Litoreibacter janthinus TaxID=670154 RepID=A0A1I6IFR2_9RHOB|nr:thiopurine S-methyltransferase [Litoreibacter janthinus]SFR65160.1 thiopurine S-methyltransferase [Litoreibacter janthinus]